MANNQLAPNSKAAIAKARMGELKTVLEKNLPNIRQIAAKHLTPERMIKVVLGAASRNPFILECTPLSIVKATLQAAELGLEPGSALGEFWLVPFSNKKTGQREAQGIPGYRGLISLARRTGEISNLYAESVYEGDDFNVELGLDPKLEHKPDYDNDSRENAANLRFVYAVARFKDGSFQFTVLSRGQIEALRRRSKAADSGPWVTDFEEMAKKTAIRRLSKYLPMSTEMGKALELQARAEAGNFDEPTVIDGDISLDDSTAMLPAESQEAEDRPATSGKGGSQSLKDAIKSATGHTHAEQPAAAQQTNYAAGPEDEDLFN